jgi:hypothetical protein
MISLLSLFLHVLVSSFKTQARLEAEIVVLRHQLNVLRRRVPSKPKLAVADRLLFVWLYRLFPAVLGAIAIIQPETVIRWHRILMAGASSGQKTSMRPRMASISSVERLPQPGAS